MEKERLKLALGHQARVGKDTLANYVANVAPTSTFSFAEDVYKIAEMIQKFLGKPVVKDPGLLQLIGTGLREHYGNNIWIDRTMEKIKSEEAATDKNIIVTDMRFQNELETLKENGFTTIKIMRENRPIDRDPNHISEIALANAKFDYTINNNSSLEDFIKEIDNVVNDIRKEKSK